MRRHYHKDLEELKKPYIGVCVSFFEDVSCLPHCLFSVLGQNPKLAEYVKVLALDGRYKGYPSKNSLSQDGSREVIKDFQDQYGKDKIELFDVPNLLERQKRQRYVDLAAEQGIPFIIILDSDEYIQCKKPHTFLEELLYVEQEWKRTNLIEPSWTNPKIGNVTQVKCIDLDDNGFPSAVMLRPRLWHRPQDMHYTSRHYWFKRKDQLEQQGTFNDGSEYKSLSVEQLVIWHDHSCRSEDRENRRVYYEQERLPALEG